MSLNHVEPQMMEQIHDSNMRVKLPHKPFSIKTLNKRSKKHKHNRHKNDPNENQLLDEEQIQILKEKKRQTLMRIEQLKSLLDPKNVYPKYPYLQLPYRFEDPIADPEQYNKSFRLPGKICPLIYKIDPKTTSLEQLELEKKIMKQKIRDLIAKKSAIIGSKLYESKVKKKGVALKKKTKQKETVITSASILRRDKKPDKPNDNNMVKQTIKQEESKQQEQQETEEEQDRDLNEDQDQQNQDDFELERQKSTLAEIEILAESIPESDDKQEINETNSKTENSIANPEDAKSNTVHTSSTPSVSKESKKDKKKDGSSKKKAFDEERIRLYSKNLNRQIERENCYNLIKQSIKEKKEEIYQLKDELEHNKKELKLRLKEIRAQTNELERNIEKELELINSTKGEFTRKLNEKLIEKRRSLKTKFEEDKLAKRIQADEKKVEVDYVLTVYPKTTSLKAVHDKKLEIDLDYDEWVKENEFKMLEDESDLYDKINNEEDKFLEFMIEEEEKIIGPLKENKSRLLCEDKELNESFEVIQEKLSQRIKLLEEEVGKLEKEKEIIEETNEDNIRIQTEKLNELLLIEREAKEKIREELENYRDSIMKIREKNLKMRYDLTILKHMHGITRAYVFSYFSILTIYGTDEKN